MSVSQDEMLAYLTKLKMIVPRWAPAEISPALADVWLQVLRGIDRDTLTKALTQIANNEEQWPSPAKVKRLCQGSNQTDEEIGSEIAARIEGAMRKFGYTQPDKAMEFLGDIGKEVVRISGGWQSMCDLTSDQIPGARKMWRDLATQVSRRAFAGDSNQAPRLTQTKSQYLQQALDTIQGPIDR